MYILQKTSKKQIKLKLKNNMIHSILKVKPLLMIAFLSLMLSESSSGQVGKPEPFKINIPQEKLNRVLTQFKSTKFPDKLTTGKWDLGTSSNFMETFRTFVLKEYDWRTEETALNKFDQFRVNIDDYNIHYYHVKGEGNNPRPVILSHGWPGSVFEFLNIIERLTQPSKFGGNTEDALTVVIPSVPGFGWSTLAENKAIGPKTTADLYHKLMTQVLGYQKFGAQGGDIGSLIVSQLAARHPENVVGVHMNIIPWDWKQPENRTPEERAWFDEGQIFQRVQFDYFFMQSQEPTTVAFALHDNPVGIAGWILDKAYSWTDHEGDLTTAISMKDLATFVMIYALTDTIDSSVWWYHGAWLENNGIFHPTPGKKVNVPTAFANFPKDLKNAMPPRSWVEDQYQIVRWTEMSGGGHFAAVEKPALFVKDVLEFFSKDIEK
ncbi:epoxide hydrolase family protein [uncultured Aquimarina sp.]|uniref:epoxide hydrolase family protein n=1 Tax=uncultured Aquimarina sp. TaxID=575652 RepID=UPI00261E9E07|nr:epoxide hydrolase family protein [uncultured Aquimarina sp.]